MTTYLLLSGFLFALVGAVAGLDLIRGREHPLTWLIWIALFFLGCWGISLGLFH